MGPSIERPSLDDDARENLLHRDSGESRRDDYEMQDFPFLKETDTHAVPTDDENLIAPDTFEVSSQSILKEIVLQTFPVTLLCLVGGMLAGQLLSDVEQWPTFVQVPELFILVPILLNLKGNIEMNFGARLSTGANSGALDDPDERRTVIIGSLTLLQVQAMVVSCVAGILAYVLGVASRGGGAAAPDIELIESLNSTVYNDTTVLESYKNETFIASLNATMPQHDSSLLQELVDLAHSKFKGGIRELLLVLDASLSAACMASLVMGAFVSVVVLACRRFHVNPDNVTTPLATVFSDIMALLLLSLAASLLAPVIMPVGFVLTPLFVAWTAACAYHLHGNAVVAPYLKQGWSPLFAAMAFSSVTGLVLESAVTSLDGFASLAPVVSALAGNAGCIYASRLSTDLHLGGPRARTRLVAFLLYMVTESVVVLLMFLRLPAALATTPAQLVFALCYVGGTTANIFLTLALSVRVVDFFWARGCDPDIYALPIISSLSDVVSQVLLVGVFKLTALVTGVSFY